MSNRCSMKTQEMKFEAPAWANNLDGLNEYKGELLVGVKFEDTLEQVIMNINSPRT